MTEQILADLNNSQKEAVRHSSGPLFIIAGAGTGKTRVITRRIAYLIDSGEAKQDEILALTFTDKAAAQMQERVDILVPYGFTDIRISTFHAFGDQVLRDHAFELGLSPDFKVLTRPETVVFFREHLFEFPLKYYRPLSDPTKFIEAMVNLFSRAKDEDVSADEYIKYVERLEDKVRKNPEDLALNEELEKQKEIANCYLKYQELLSKQGKVDFANQFYLTLQLFRKHPRILKEYQERFKYILVDEFQDTNYAQFELIKLLAGSLKNITVVADDDQCLIGSSLIETPQARRRIENIKRGDLVLTAVGKSRIGISRVKNVFKKKRKARLLTFETQNGNKITVTSNHKMFCFVPTWPIKKTDKIYYVYLMWRKDLGWRLGVSDDLVVRLRIERSADKIVGLRAFKTKQEAQYFETYLSLKYGIPTVCFMKRKGLFIIDESLKKLHQELNTEERVKALATDLDIDLNFHHYCLDAVTRGNKIRVKINLYLCDRKYTSKEHKSKILKNPSILHRVTLETSDKPTVDRLRKAGFHLASSRKGFRLSYSFSDFKEAEDLTCRLKEITGGILEYKFTLGKLNIVNLPAVVMPASNVLLGHYLPIKKDNQVIYDKIIDIKEAQAVETVYDLEVERTHNFIANGIVVHNCIYKWRGAAISNILNFMDTYPKVKKISLTQNYRSKQEILDSAYKLIQFNNPERFEVKANIDKRLKSITGEGGVVGHRHFDTVSTEADSLANIIEDGIKSKKYNYNDFAILVRSNSDAEPFLKAMNMKGIPWRFSGNQGLYSREEIRLCIAFLRLMADLSDSLSLYHLSSSGIYQVPLVDLTRCMNYSSRRNLELFKIFQDIDSFKELGDISSEAKATIEKIVKDIEKFLDISRGRTTGQTLYKFLTDTAYIKRLVKQPSVANEEKLKNIAKFFDMVRNFETVAREDRTIYFVNYLDMLIQAGDDPATVEADLDTEAVNVLTIHKAKGLEFNVVFMVSLVSGRFPWPRRHEAIELPEELIKDILPAGDYRIQEERRLFYVGMTRAKDELYFSSARDYGGQRRRKISRFIQEALDIKEEEGTKKTEALEAIERNAPKLESKLGSIRQIPEEEVLNLSHYKIDDYLTCPLKYKYVHILRVPILTHHTVIYGRAMHEAVLRYHQLKIRGKTISEKDLVGVFESLFKQEGFLSKKHFQERLLIGKKALRRFLKEQEKTKITPTFVEKDFSFTLGNDRIIGRWDRIDIHNEEVILIDFKSSEIKKQQDADKRTKNSLQLSVYSLAYSRVFGKLPDWVELHFLESGLVGRAKRTEKDIENATEKIKQASSGIRKANFEAKPAYLACSYCAYNQICPYAVIRRH